MILMARRRSALPVITEPTIDPEHLTALQVLAEESQRRNSTNSIRLVSKIQSYKFANVFQNTSQLHAMLRSCTVSATGSCHY